MNALAKPAEWHAERRKGIGGSDAATIMSGEWLALWEEKTGRREPEDLSHVLPVQIGIITEPLNLIWFARETGHRVTRQGESVAHPSYGFMRCTLDGVAPEVPAVVQCKHVNAFAKVEDVAQKYMPQVHHEMPVTDLPRAFLSVFVGTLTYELIEIERDDFFVAQLIDREREFWKYVEADEPPPSREPIASPVLPAKFRVIDMTGNNQWGAYAADWLDNREAAKSFEAATKGLKALVEADVGEAQGHGIVIKRAKNGALSIRESK